MKRSIIAFAFIGALTFSACKSLEVTPPNNITDVQIRELLSSGDTQKVNDILSAIGVTTTYFNYYNTYTGYSSTPQNTQFDQDYIRTMVGNDVVLGTKEAALSGGHMVYYDLESLNWLDRDNDSPWWNMPVDFYIAANKTLNFITKEVVENNPALGPQRADALVLRAWGYLLLQERFEPAYAQKPDGRGLPIYTEYRVNPVAEISSAKVVYESILGWLNEAIDLYKASGKGYTAAYNDYDLGVAQYVIMRAALEFGDYDTVIKNGKELTAAYPDLIPVEKYGAKNVDLDDYCSGAKELNAKDNAFCCAAANPEAILAFPKGALYNRTDFYADLNCFAAGIGKSYPRIDDRLYDKIANNDVRKSVFTDHEAAYTYVTNVDDNITNTITIPTYTTMKWGATTCLDETKRSQRTYSDDIVIRASEVYLMLAEAYASDNKDSEAVNILNKLLAARATSGSLTTSSMSGLSTLDMVKLQWRIEMWAEKGLEFYNNKRWGVAVDRNGSKLHYSKGKTLSVDQMTIEVPRAEQTANTNWGK